MAYVFVSLVGTQVRSVLNPLEACLLNNIPLSKIVFFCTPISKNAADNMQLYAMEKEWPDIEILEWERNKEHQLLDHVEVPEGDTILFNVNGGMNYAASIIEAQLMNTPGNAITMTTHSDVSIIKLDSLDTQKLPLPPMVPVHELLEMQDIKYQEDNDTPDYLAEFCRAQGITMPKNSLHNVIIDGLRFSLVWNTPENILTFFICTNTPELFNKDKKEQLDYIRNIASWCGTRTLKNHLYDRKCFVFCYNTVQAQHLKESRAKATALSLTTALYFDRVGGKNSKNPALYAKKLKQELIGIFHPEQEKTSSIKGSRKILSDSLILALGDDLAPTLNAIESRDPSIKNIYIFHTTDDEHTALAEQVKQALNTDDLAIKPMPCDLNGTLLPKKLKIEEKVENIHVNITPGTKGATCFLTWWAVKNGADIWSLVNGEGVVRCLNAEKQDLPLKAFDPLSLIRIKDPEVYENSPLDSLNETTFHAYELLLKQLKAMMDAGVGQYPEPDKEEHTYGGVKSSLLGDLLILSEPSDKDFGYSLEYDEHCDWFEVLTAVALKKCGAENIHVQVRQRFDEETEAWLQKHIKTSNENESDGDNDDSDEIHRIDMDVLCTWKGAHVLVSCKKAPARKRMKAIYKHTADEARNMASSISRFCVPVIACLNFKEYPVERNQVSVITAKELCDPDALVALLDHECGKGATTRGHIS